MESHVVKRICRFGSLGLRVLNVVGNRHVRPKGAGGTKILLVKLDAIGDFVLATAFLRELRQSFPHADITLVVTPVTAPLAEPCPYIDRVLVFDPQKAEKLRAPSLCFEALRFARSLRGERFDSAVLLRWDVDGYKGYHIVTGVGAQRVYMFRRSIATMRSGWLRNSELRNAVVLEEGTPESEARFNLRLLEAMGGRVVSDHPELWLSESDKLRADSWLREHAGDRSNGPLIAFGIGASIREKCWPIEKFVALAGWLAAEYAAKIILVGGGANDVELAGKLLEKSKGEMTSAVDAFSLRETAALIGRCHLFVGNDSGPAHLAAGVGIPVVQIFGICRESETECHFPATRFAVWGVPAKVIRPSVSGSRNATFDMLGISLEEVAGAVRELLAECYSMRASGVC